MPRNAVRVMKGQVAAVYGLMFVGVSFSDAVSIVGASYGRIRPYILDGWLQRTRLPVQTKHMTGHQRYQHDKFRLALGRSAAIKELKRTIPPAAAVANTGETNGVARG